jgi:hypothetical protein
MVNNTNSLLGVAGPLQAAGADVVVNNHFLTVTGCPSMDFRKIESTTGFLASIAEVLTQYTVTPTVVSNNTTYTISIQQFVPALGRIVDRQLTYTTQSTGDTATTICNALRAQLTTLSDLQITGSGTTTLILTGKAGSPVFSVVNNQPITNTIVLNVAGNFSRGTYNDLVRVGVVGAAPGQVYSQVTFDWIQIGAGETNGMPNLSRTRHTLYVNQAAVNFGAFSTALTNALTAVANPELLAVA